MAEKDDRSRGTVVRTPGGGYSRGLLQPGQTLMGTYRIRRMAGSPGGMGQLYEAEDETLGTQVAIKVPALEILLTAEGPERFLREARTAARLRRYPHIVQIYLCHADPAVTVRVGSEEIPIPFIVMEYLGGGDLAALIQHGPLDLPTVSAVFTDICSAIQYAHAYHDDERAIRGVIHRDLKPENICFDETGRLVIVDFGIAKLREGGRTSSTAILGTPTYMAPEQWNGKGIDHRTDIYALGVILYQMVTGQLPFDASSYEGLIAGHLFQNPPDPRSLRPELPAGVAEAILKALEKDKEARFESAEAFAQAVAAGFKRSGGSAAKVPDVEPSARLSAELLAIPSAGAERADTPWQLHPAPALSIGAAAPSESLQRCSNCKELARPIQAAGKLNCSRCGVRWVPERDEAAYGNAGYAGFPSTPPDVQSERLKPSAVASMEDESLQTCSKCMQRVQPKEIMGKLCCPKCSWASVGQAGSQPRANLHGSPGRSVGQNRWEKLTPNGPPPPARYSHSAVWDEVAHKMYVFGGQVSHLIANDLWVYMGSNNSWEKLTPAGMLPPDRQAHSAVWDPEAGRMYVFGGTNGSGGLDDLWAYVASSNSWEKLTGSNRPFPVSIDYNANSSYGDKLTPGGNLPLARFGHSAILDPKAGKMYIFGGWRRSTSGAYQQADDIWTYTANSNSWDMLTPTGAPPPLRNAHTAAWDPRAGKMYVFGGAKRMTSVGCDDLWVYTASRNSWEQLTSARFLV